MTIVNRSWDGEKLQWSANATLWDFDGFMKNVNKNDFIKSGCRILSVGVESFNKEVRDSMNKPEYENEELAKWFDFALENDIKIYVYLMVGYITETDQQFDDGLIALKGFFDRYSACIGDVAISFYTIHSEYNYIGYEDQITFDSDGNWIYKDNIHEKRVDRVRRLKELSMNYDVHPRLMGTDDNEKNEV